MKKTIKLLLGIGIMGCLFGFTANAVVILNDFSFIVKGDPGVTITYEAIVAPWNGNVLGGNSPQGAGTPIWTGPSSTFVDNGSFQTVTVTTPGLSLAPGNWFIGLYATDGNGASHWGLASLNSHLADNGGGGFNFNNGPVVGTWDDFSDFGDLAFSASLSSGNLSTIGSWDGSTTVQPWGAPLSTAVYGQTLVVPPVPEPSTFIAGALMLLPFGAQVIRRLRNRQA
jgi:hypothetical protein